jgi:hypothetical protein
MEYVYVIVENDEAYPNAYKSYACAVNAVKFKYRTYLETMIKETAYLEDIESILADINVPENILGKSYLYIEKGINIVIYKLPVCA